MKTQRKKGFTMVELVIVIAVIAILAAVLIPTFVNLTKKANEAAALADARNIANQILADMLKGGGKDILVFEQKGDELYIHGYCAEAGRVLAYYGNPIKLEGEGTLAEKVEKQLKVMAEKGEVVPAAVPSAEDWWSSEKMATAAEELGYSAETTVLRADYQIVPVKFAKDETPVDEVHNCKESLTHYEGQPANCTQAGYDEYWICNKCGKMYRDADATTELEKVEIEQALGHNYVNGVCSRCEAKEPSNGGNNGGNTNPTPAPTPTETTNPTEPSTAEPTEPSTEPEQTEEEKLIATVNAALAADASRNGNPKTMHDAMTAIGTYKTQVQAAGLLWDSVKNEFCTETEVTERLKDTTRKKYEFWQIQSKSFTPQADGYSYYLADGYTAITSFTSGKKLSTGLDVGNNTTIAEILFSNGVNKNKENKCIIRTNAGTTLTVQQGIVIHYGVADTVTVGALRKTSTYVENGTVTGLLKVAKARSVTVTIKSKVKAARAIVFTGSDANVATITSNGMTPICYTSVEPKVTNAGNGHEIGQVCSAAALEKCEGFGTAAYPFLVGSKTDWSNLNSLSTSLTIYAKVNANYTPESLVTSIATSAKTVLDLNGHTISLGTDGSIQVGAKGLTIKDSSNGKGSITQSGTSTKRGVFASYVSGATVTIEGGSFTGSFLVGRSVDTKNETGSTPIYNGETSITITVKGGTFTFTSDPKAFLCSELQLAKLSLQGGTFNAEPEATYLASGYAANNNGNGTWTVTLN